MGSAVEERRRSSRFDAALLVHLKATLRPGNAVVLVNLATGGALVHSMRPLRPGGRLHVQIAGGTHVVRIAAHVLRCGVAGLSATNGAVYAGALKFDRECDLPWAHPGRAG